MSGIVVLILRSLTTLALYLFLGWSLLTLWKDLRQQQKTDPNQQAPGIYLQFEIDEQLQARRYPGPEIILGRDPTCDCTLVSETVSARHARISFHHKQWWLEDLGSTNGTFLNQELVEVPTVIVPGDQIHCGDVPISLTHEDPPA